MWNLRCLPEVPCQPIGFPLFSESDFVPAVGAQAAAAAAAAAVVVVSGVGGGWLLGLAAGSFLSPGRRGRCGLRLF